MADLSVSVVVPVKQNSMLIDSIKKQLSKNDEIHIFDISKYPSKKIQETLGRAKGKIIVFINPSSKIVIDGFIDIIREAEVSAIYLRRPDESCDKFVKGNIKELKRDDCIWFHRSMYRGNLRDFSSHMDYDTVLRTITRPFFNNVRVPAARVDSKAEYEEIFKLERTARYEEIKKFAEKENIKKALEEEKFRTLEAERLEAIRAHQETHQPVTKVKKQHIPESSHALYPAATPRLKKQAEQNRVVAVKPGKRLMKKIVEKPITDFFVGERSISIKEIMLEDDG